MNFLNRTSKFLSEIRSELKKVHWPTRRQFSVFFAVVLATVVAIGTFFWVLDYGLTIMVDMFILP